VELTTARLRMRPLRADDARTLHAAYSDPETLRYWHRTPRRTEDETRTLLEGELVSHVWAICLAGGDDAIGHVGFDDPIRHRHQTPFGYLLRREHWGRGYVVEAAHAVLDHGYAELGLGTCELWVYDGNDRSRSVAEKLGARYRGASWMFNLERRAALLTHVYELPPPRPTGAALLPEVVRAIPVLTVPDVPAAIEWWRDAVGFALEWQLERSPQLASMVSPGFHPLVAVLRLAEGDPVPSRIVLHVPRGLDDLAAAMPGSPAPVDEPYGLRRLEVTDPWGNVAVFEGPPAG
jgi:RimJ/RimL family protein N-acetyltransferase/catechol 2,3-dioxygenase-like lactoylglutathione lyase family enzyme